MMDNYSKIVNANLERLYDRLPEINALVSKEYWKRNKTP